MEVMEANKASIEGSTPRSSATGTRRRPFYSTKLEKTSSRKREQEEKEIQDEKNWLGRLC